MELDEKRTLISESGLFDSSWYLATYSDIDPTKIDPLMHYLEHGEREKRNPNAEFSVDFYLREYSDILGINLGAFVHYLLYGKEEGRFPNQQIKDDRERIAQEQRALEEKKTIINDSGLFDKNWYLQTYSDVANGHFDPLTHYVENGEREGRNPSEKFSNHFYLWMYDDIKKNASSPLLHYIAIGKSEGRFATQKEKDEWDRKNEERHLQEEERIRQEEKRQAHAKRKAFIQDSGLFDGNWYLATYKDISDAEIDPLDHYINHGEKEGRDPSDKFSTHFYLSIYPDIRENGISPFQHYITIGKSEGRLANQKEKDELERIAEELRRQEEERIRKEAERRVLEQTIQYILQSGFFDENWYLSTYPESQNHEFGAIGHYLEVGEKEGKNPSSQFSSTFYLQMYPDIIQNGLSPLLHYINNGKAEGRYINSAQKEQADQLAYEEAIRAHEKAVLKQNIAIVKESGLFDKAWYLATYKKGFCMSKGKAIAHYLETGEKEGYDPSPEFSVNFYLETYPEIKTAGIGPLLHYIKFGKTEGRYINSHQKVEDEKRIQVKLILDSKVKLVKESGLFDEKFYLKEYPEVLDSSMSPIEYYLEIGEKKGHNPSPEFSVHFYLETYPIIQASQLSPLIHYIIHGQSENRVINETQFEALKMKEELNIYKESIRIIQESGFFDKEYYLETYSTVKKYAECPILHYIKHGEKQGQNPSKQVSLDFYLNIYPDIKASGISPLIHYILFGKNEGRIIHPQESVKFEKKMAEWRADLLEKSKMKPKSLKNPLVSIILPTKNRAELLNVAIGSVLEQTYQNWELLIIDDHSTDETVKLVKEKYKDARIILLSNDGVGVSAARNTGLSNIQGEYVAYLDSDNQWAENYLEYMIREFQRTGDDWAYAVMKYCADYFEDGYTRYINNEFSYDKLKQFNFIDANVFMHRRYMYDLYGGFDTSLKRFVDWDLVLKYTRLGSGKLNYFVGCYYNDNDRKDRITVSESDTYHQIIVEKYRELDKE